MNPEPFLPDPAADAPTPRMLSWTRNSTIYRVERQMLTEKQLADAIRRKAKEKFDGITEMQVRACADFAVKFAYDVSALDDAAYAGIATRSGVRSGRSKRAIAQRLAVKGIARKRAFGPFRKTDLDEKRQAKELSAFARGGFGFGLARRVFDMSFEDAEEVLSGRRV